VLRRLNDGDEDEDLEETEEEREAELLVDLGEPGKEGRCLENDEREDDRDGVGDLNGDDIEADGSSCLTTIRVKWTCFRISLSET
jgi:hypothetical protein